MEVLGKILAVVAVIALVVMFVFYKKANPQLFTKEAFSKSFMTIGILALCLIAFVALLVILTRA